MVTFHSHSVHQAEVDWTALADSVFARSAGATKPSDTYKALTWALKRVDRHSFLMPPPEKSPSAMMGPAPRPALTVAAPELSVDRRIGGVVVNGHSGPNRISYVDSIHARIAALDSARVCGWIVDLRGNTGGNMWPMLAGIGPLLGAEYLGSFTNSPPGAGWHYRDGKSWFGLDTPPIQVAGWGTSVPKAIRNPDAPVALLIGRKTASSGELTLLAFLGRPNVRTFGDSTAGYTSSNSSIPLRDGATMVVTSSYPRDRLGRAYPLSVTPDDLVPAGEEHGKDAVIVHATAWLLQQAGCR
jgi:C-terminal processing protease CtpA/Prc